jgi:hypothetical protein
VGDVRQTEMHTDEPFVSETSASEVEVGNGKLKRYEFPDVHQIPAELIQAVGETLHLEIYKLIKLIWNKELPHQWKESTVVPVHKKGDKTDCNNYRGTPLLSISYKILSNILPSRLTPYADEITGNHQCGFLHNRSMSDQIFYIQQILKKKWKYNGTIHQLFIDFKKAHNSVRSEELYNILNEFARPRKLDGLIKMHLDETCSTVHTGKNLSDKFPTQNGVKQKVALTPMLSNMSLGGSKMIKKG